LNEDGEPDAFRPQQTLVKILEDSYPALVYVDIGYKGKRAYGWFLTLNYESTGILEKRSIPIKELRAKLK
jgi:hypothetical protein